MFLLAHAGFALVAGRLAALRVPGGLPARGLAALAFGAVLPDLLDKPLGVLVLQVPEGRLVGHTLLFALAWLLVGYAWKRSLTAPPALVGWGCLTHLLLDLPLAGTVLWPFLGAFPVRGKDYANIVEELLGNPVLVTGEVLGGLVVGYHAFRFAQRSWDPATRRFRVP